MKLASVLCVLALALVAQPALALETCGNLGEDNRPNKCQKKVGGTYVQSSSKCRKISDGVYEYEHCAGVKKTYSGAKLCCVESNECKGAFYVAECLF